MKHNRAYHRFKDEVKKQHKIQIVRHWGKHWQSNLENPHYLGKLVKGKVHCSCPMCAVKTKTYGPKISELRKTSEDLLKEYNEAYQELAL
jgi:hypothetical protein